MAAKRALKAVTVGHCARCGKTHHNIMFKKFKVPALAWTHWASCPKTKEPILMQLV